ncbi:sirohydrochlorin ferrochelatase [Neobacillus ginsengisoli]|uniref:Sirohydrochlorin ferrochelatase n=2 Tax=Neobacillus ginsengisoli TaxID=904295 RepID=A0ABT9Y380_9BACI|nr:sirohydrochlorin ferrochelatase [Neobacillus ginsengisoli]
MTMEAIIYIAHGSRRTAANEKFISFIRRIKNKPGGAIHAYGFLEHAEPSISQAIEMCIDKGANKITVVPVLLLPGIHANEDIPNEFKGYPDIVFRYAEPLGVDEIMVEVLMDRLKAAGFEQTEDNAVLVVGHGSREQETAIEFETLARRLSGEMNVEVHTAYLTTPVFYLEMVEKLVDKRIYVLPYLLFSGGYKAKMEKELRMYDESIKLCDPVGFDEKLIPLIQKRAGEVRT